MCTCLGVCACTVYYKNVFFFILIIVGSFKGSGLICGNNVVVTFICSSIRKHVYVLIVETAASWYFTTMSPFSVSVFAAKFVPLAYGIKKLQISCVVEDDKVTYGS